MILPTVTSPTRSPAPRIALGAPRGALEGTSAPWRLRRSELWALGPVWLLLGIAYGLTLCPTVWWYDSAEFAASARALNSPHPPGYPTYTFVAHVFSQLGPEPAWGVNFMSLVFGVVGVSLLYVVQRQLGVRRSVAAAMTLAFGVGTVWWSNAVVAEVYTPGATCTLGALALLLAARDHGRVEYCVAAAGVAGLGLGTHLSIATAGLGFVWLVVTTALDVQKFSELPGALNRSGVARIWPVAWRCTLALAVALLPFVLLPFWDFNRITSAGEWRQWWYIIRGGAFDNLFDETWSKADYLARNWAALGRQLSTPLLVTGFVGLALLLRRRPVEGLGVWLALGGNLGWFWNYRVHDIEVFFLPAAALLALGVGEAVETALRGVERIAAEPVARGLTFASSLLLVVAASHDLGSRWKDVDYSDRWEAALYGKALVEQIPANAYFVKYNNHEEWKYFAVLLYAQKGFGEREDLIVYTNPSREQLVRWTKERPVYVFAPTARVKGRLKVRREGPAWRVVEVK